MPQGQEPGTDGGQQAEQDGPHGAPAPEETAKGEDRVLQCHGRLGAAEHGVHVSTGDMGTRNTVPEFPRLHQGCGEKGYIHTESVEVFLCRRTKITTVLPMICCCGNILRKVFCCETFLL